MAVRKPHMEDETESGKPAPLFVAPHLVAPQMLAPKSHEDEAKPKLRVQDAEGRPRRASVRRAEDEAKPSPGASRFAAMSSSFATDASSVPV